MVCWFVLMCVGVRVLVRGVLVCWCWRVGVLVRWCCGVMTCSCVRVLHVVIHTQTQARAHTHTPKPTCPHVHTPTHTTHDTHNTHNTRVCVCVCVCVLICPKWIDTHRIRPVTSLPKYPSKHRKKQDPMSHESEPPVGLLEGCMKRGIQLVLSR